MHSSLRNAVPSQHTLLKLIALLLCLTLSIASSSSSAESSTSQSEHAALWLPKRQLGQSGTLPPFSCESVGECLACSALQIQAEDTCKETHNRQRIECKFEDPKDDENEELKIRLPTYRSCPRVKAVEARKFAHFFSTNIFLALFSGILMVWRKRKLAAAQYRRMARRIGNA
ncbi:unnamed protein product [Mortierella alpina]